MSILLGFCLIYLGVLTGVVKELEAPSQKASEKWLVSPCLVYHNPYWACVKIKDLIEKGFYVESLNCKCLKSCDWSHYFCADTSEICGCSWPEHSLRRKQRAVVMTLGLLVSARNFPVPQDSRQVPSERWSCRQTSPLSEHVLPLPAQMSGLRLTARAFCERCPLKGWKQWARASWD